MSRGHDTKYVSNKKKRVIGLSESKGHIQIYKVNYQRLNLCCFWRSCEFIQSFIYIGWIVNIMVLYCDFFFSLRISVSFRISFLNVLPKRIEDYSKHILCLTFYCHVMLLLLYYFRSRDFAFGWLGHGMSCHTNTYIQMKTYTHTFIFMVFHLVRSFVQRFFSSHSSTLFPRAVCVRAFFFILLLFFPFSLRLFHWYVYEWMPVEHL